MARRSRPEEDPSCKPSSGPELACEKCGAASDPWRGMVTRYWCGGRIRMLHRACRDVIELENAGKL
jgi:hypothetical protein